MRFALLRCVCTNEPGKPHYWTLHHYQNSLVIGWLIAVLALTVESRLRSSTAERTWP